MKIVTAIDSFKGCLSSIEAGEAIREGILKAIGHANVQVRPLADGGEGTVEALVLGMQGRIEKVLPVQSGTSANGPWRRQDFIIAFQEDPRDFFFQRALLSADLEKHPEPKEGSIAKVSWSVFTNEYNGRYYNQLKVITMEVEESEKEEDKEELGF